MKKNAHIVRYSAEQIAEMIDRGEDRTDWARVNAMSQAEVERLADEEDGPMPEGWEQTIQVGPAMPKRDIHIRLDADILDWFKANGKGYQTRINTVLRAFVQARRNMDSPEGARAKSGGAGFSETDSGNALERAGKQRR